MRHIAALLLVPMFSLVGCSSDLFHSTSWPTACEIDPTASGCGGEQVDAGDTDTSVNADASMGDAQPDQAEASATDGAGEAAVEAAAEATTEDSPASDADPDV